MKLFAFKILNYFTYLYFFLMFVTHLNQSGNEWQVQNQVLFYRCPDFPVSNESYLYFTNINVPDYQPVPFGFF